ncbi:ASKHA domain-containing protein [Deferrisoma palaeochoriense]
MPEFVWTPGERRIAFRRGERLLDALRRAGIDLEAPCGGKGVCGKCRVRVRAAGGVPATPHEKLSAAEAADGVRLACRLAPEDGWRIEPARPPESDLRVVAAAGGGGAPVRPAVRVFRAADGWAVRFGRGRPRPLPRWEVAWRPRGVALDLGTTTLVVSLLDLPSGERLAVGSGRNPQTRFGHDVVSRILVGSRPEGLRALRDAVRSAVRDLVAGCCREAGVEPEEILEMVVGGNTTMLHLAVGEDPSPLGHAPFRHRLRTGTARSLRPWGLGANPAARLYLPPVAHAFVGSDVTVGLWVTGFFRARRPELFLDVGTNGEVALTTGVRRLVTSAAAGPAFEGMGIRFGMRAAAGAIERVGWDGRDLTVEVIGGGPARGICGSGLLDAVAVLLDRGVIDARGRVLRPGEYAGPAALRDRLGEYEGKPAVHLADGVFLTQADVRQVQLAKGAIRAAVDCLLDAAGLGPEDLGRVVLAGGFGLHLWPGGLERIGLLPPGLADRVEFAGNTSQGGCEAFLRDAGARGRLRRAVRSLEHLGLAGLPAFRDRFMAAMRFPPVDGGTVGRWDGRTVGR